MEGKIMQLVQYSSYGGGVSNLKHIEGAIPTPKADEVLVKVEATGIHLLDVKTQKGIFRPFLPSKFPFTPGSDVAGEIVEVGSQVTKFKVGDKVVTHLKMAGGGLAEYTIAKEAMTAIRPAGVSAVEAAGLPIAGFTAYDALTHYCGLKLDAEPDLRFKMPEAVRPWLDGTGDKKNILITAASGSTGHYAVQLAKLSNTHVTATCGARNLELVKSLGADEVLDYRTPEGASLKSPSGKKYDYIINGAPGTPWSAFAPNLATKGRVIDITPPGLASASTFFIKKLTFSNKRLVFLTFFTAKAETLEYLANLVSEKKLKTIVDSTYPLSKVEDAWEKVASGRVTGKVIVEILA